MVGFFLLFISNLGLGIISHLASPLHFKYIALVLRYIEGQGDVLLQFTSYSVITSVFFEDLTTHIGYLEVAAGLGLSLGPIMGAMVFPLLNYEGTMYFFSMLSFATALVCYIFMPN
jgi:hypothetical protein